jgi:hypothetical protein
MRCALCEADAMTAGVFPSQYAVDVGLRDGSIVDLCRSRSAALTGSAAGGIARRLRRRGYDVVGSQSYLVEDAEGPLEDGELQRGREWGAELAKSSAAADG